MSSSVSFVWSTLNFIYYAKCLDEDISGQAIAPLRTEFPLAQVVMSAVPGSSEAVARLGRLIDRGDIKNVPAYCNIGTL